MVNHEAFMKAIEYQMHGSMTTKERLAIITRIVNEYKLKIEEETGASFESGLID